jgi:AraC family ethanolamine operon transcriptional activator
MVLVADGGADFTIAVEAELDWLAVFVPSSLLKAHETERAVGRTDRTTSRVLRPGTECVARLRFMLTQAVEAARIEPAVLTAPASLGRMQADLLAACRSVVGQNFAPAVATGRPLIPRSEIIRTAKDLIDRCEDMLPGIDDLARAADVSVRTLHTAFIDYYGLPPLRYLTLRRLHEVRDALRKADPDRTTVTRIAVRFGFWQFGRFAGQYRRLFGEKPSETLHRGRKIADLVAR